MNKYGVLNSESRSDFDSSKKAEYFDADGYEVADENNKENLKSPKKIEQIPDEAV
jgi:hypothetical protein